MTSRTATTIDARPVRAARPVSERRERRAASSCDVWGLVAPGEPCPACARDVGDGFARAVG